MSSASKSKIAASLLALVAATIFITTHQLYISLSLAALGVFLWLTSGSFNGAPEEPIDSSGRKISPQEIKEYRKDHPDASISEATRALKES